MTLPHDLQTALGAALQRYPPREVAAAVRALSERYRADHARATGPFLRTDLDVAAYAAYRLPATFAATAAALRQMRNSLPDFEPGTVLDVGGGPGTAAWAAVDVWPEVRGVTILERDARMIRLGRELAAQAASAAIRDSEWRQADAIAAGETDSADLVIMSYVLGELPEESRDDAVRRLWEQSRNSCVVIEPGTPRGFALIRQAGDLLVREGAQIVAPFPWTWTCVEHDRDWCHFAARVARTRVHRSAKEGALSYEDEKYTYIAASRTPGLPIAARVIRRPQVRSGHIRLTLCTADGVRHVVVTRKNREAFRLARHLNWGSAIGPDEVDLVMTRASLLPADSR